MKPVTQTATPVLSAPIAPGAVLTQLGHPDGARLSMIQTAQLSGVSEADLLNLVEYGVLVPAAPESQPSTFDISCVMKLQRAALMREDLALDNHGFALAMMFLNQITGLEEKLYRSECDLRDCCSSGSACAKAMQ